MSVGGFDPENEIRKYRTSIPVRSRESFESPQMQGILVELDEQSGFAVSVREIRLPVEVGVPD